MGCVTSLFIEKPNNNKPFSFLAHTAEVCYPPYGCFSDDAPYDEALVQLPWGPKDLETKFWFYTRKDLSKPTGEIKEFDAQGASKVGFDPHKSTVFLTHGYIGMINHSYPVSYLAFVRF